MPMSMWLIDGREYKERIDVLVQELRRSLKTSDSYPIARLFELLPLNPATADIQGAIVARGAFVCKPGLIANSGDSVDRPVRRCEDRARGNLSAQFNFSRCPSGE